MTLDLVELSAIAAETHLDGHLDECNRRHEDWHSCPWCAWAVSVPPLETLIDARHDLSALLETRASGTVPWVVAANDLLLTIADATDDLETVHVPSVRELGRWLRRSMLEDTTALDRRVRAAVSSGGAIERRCNRTAGAVAAAAIQLERNLPLRERLPAHVHDRLERLSETLSSHVQIAGLLPTLEHLHWAPLPALHTQPAWARRPADARPSPFHNAQSTVATLTPGSLEALVVESVIEEVTSELAEIGTELSDALPPVTLGRSAHERSLSASTRHLTWRIARIDWHLTFIDTGRAACWNARVDHDVVCADVPWHVALAIDALESHGLVSATHNGRPTPV